MTLGQAAWKFALRYATLQSMVNASPPAPILFVDHATGLGGAEHSLLLLMQHLDPALWQSHLACPDGDLARQARKLGIPWQSISLPQLRRSLRFPQDWFQYANQLAQTASQVGAAAIYANTVRAAMYGMWAAKLAKRPFLWHMRDFWLSENKPRYRLGDWTVKILLCRAATQVIANSAATASHLPCPGKIAIIHNGIDLACFEAELNGHAFRQEYQIPDEAPLVGTVGRLRPWKGQHCFIEMAAAVIAAQPDTHFVVVGGSPLGEIDNYPDQLRQQVNAQNLGHCVHFTGHLSDVRPALAALDIFVHPGDPEPFGLVNVEAMAAGKPVVAFAHGALPEIVLPGKTGLLVPSGDVAGLVQAVTELLHDPDQRQQLGIAGQQRARNQFSIQQTAVHVSALLQKTLAGR